MENNKIKIKDLIEELRTRIKQLESFPDEYSFLIGVVDLANWLLNKEEFKPLWDCLDNSRDQEISIQKEEHNAFEIYAHLKQLLALRQENNWQWQLKSWGEKFGRSFYTPRLYILANFIEETIQSRQESSFDSENNILFVGSKQVKIPSDSNQSSLCKVIFQNKLSKKKTWTWDEIFEIWEGREPSEEDKGSWRKIYGAAREVNQKVLGATGIADFFITSTKTVQLNPEYV